MVTRKKRVLFLCTHNSCRSQMAEGFDFIVTTCDDARDKCPAFPGQGQKLHWDLQDPSEAEASKEKKLKIFRRVRDELENLIRSHFLSEYR